MSIALLLLEYKPVQTWAAKKATTYLSKELNTKIGIKSLYIKPFSSVVLQGFYVLDKQKDTLISTPQLTVELSGFSIFNSVKKKVIVFKSIELDNGSVYLKRQKDSTSNFKFIIDYFNKPDTAAKKKTPGKPWSVTFEKIAVKNLHFHYKNFLNRDQIKYQVNFNDADVTHFSTVLTNLDFSKHLFKASISHLTFLEKSGFYLKNLTSDATVDTDQIVLKKLKLVTPHSDITDYFAMKFKSYGAFDTLESKVHMDGDFKQAKVSSADISYFTSSLQHVFFDLGVDGRIKGFVDNLRAKSLTITAGQATYLKGDFVIKGLPHWDNTFLELKFDQIATNKKDLDLLYSRFTGQQNRHVPDLIAKFGNINFNGRFTGFQNDFIAYGEFKTKLGKFNSDINLKISKANVASYSGKINLFDFNLGELTNQSNLSRVTLSGNIEGQGFNVNTLNAKLNAGVKYIDFNNYRYNNVSLNGTFVKKQFDGKLSINDHNIKLDFDGNVNLNPALPVFNFTVDIQNARLDQIKLIKDSLTLNAKVSANFSGNSLNNFDGDLMIKKIRLQSPHQDYLVDSISLGASGKGAGRQIALRSDLADGNLKGNFDLATLPAYFKTIVKKYIPSLKMDIAEIKPQNFDFDLQIKNLDPVTLLFLPALKLPEQGNFQGKFNSTDKTATLTGIVKTFKYNKLVFHDLLIDESTTNDVLNFNVALTRIDLTDSLFIKDISITNFLKRDSLNFNVKLSDKNATNQLDLYGLVEFGRDTTAKLKLLPSDIIIERQLWKLEEQVRIRFLDGGKTQISGFELSNGPQEVKINGYLSNNVKDLLNINFKDFSMSTLNQLSKPWGIKLKGSLNGDVSLSSIMNNPGIDSKLNIDSLQFNKSLIGNIKFVTALDNQAKLANINLNILNHGLETLKANGTYDLSKQDNNVDFDLKMNQTEAIILAPFVKSLISDLKGTISSDLKMTGTLANPQLNGTLSLNNTGLTVNYLKTPYSINDNLTVKNSVINIEGMEIDDGRGGQGIANGTVDLSKDLSNPQLNVTVNARNLLALNTTFKDNRLYYGTAFGTGTFKFSGPIDDMLIDITAKTEEGTVFNIPLNTSSTASEYDFIKYVNSRDTTQAIVKQTNFKGVKLNFDLSADEKTIVKIYTDYGLLTGTGTANKLILNINSLGDFEIRGDYLISSGKFEFTAKDVISKIFQVNQGGTIRWTGSPSNAEINLNAIYEVRADISKLYQAAGFPLTNGSNSYKLVQAELILSKSLVHPNIDFDFNFPADPSIKTDLSTYLNDYTNRSLQAVSLIVRRNFAPGTGGTGSNNLTNQVASTAGEAISEFAFNKFNNIFSQSNIKNFDLNIKSFNDASASFKFLNDRLSLSGSLFNLQGSNQLFGASQNLLSSNFNNLTKDFEAQYAIRKDGRLMATYSYRILNNSNVTTSLDQLGIQYVNGIGLVYRRDFDTFGEFLKNIFGKKQTAKKTGTTTAPVTDDKGDDN